MLKKYLVNVPVANLRREPIEGRSLSDPHQETQLLFNEPLKGFGINNGWVYVEAIEQQKCFANGEWRGYPGWVRADALIEVEQYPKANLCIHALWSILHTAKGETRLSLGTRLEGIEERGSWRVRLPDGSEGSIAKEEVSQSGSQEWRSELVKRGMQMIDAPYFWGGRSAYCPGRPLTSVDCSGLVQLLYRTVWRSLPRDAHDQFLHSYRKESSLLEPGDLVFTASSNSPSRINHVMIYLGEDQLLEAEMKAQKVRVVSAQDKLGVSLKKLPWGYQNGKDLIYSTCTLLT
jgi:gamma-D-glutamyl-L-lysine dipeptidyl-peptidase